MPDFEVEVKEDGETYHYFLDNREFTTYLAVTKIDSQTGKTVLKPNTTYQIFSLDENGEETLITQRYNNGNKIVIVNEFKSDSSGKIITYEQLTGGQYRIKETNSAEGLHNARQYVDIEITNKSYVIETDENGEQYKVAYVEYYNDETYGQLTLEKTGEILKDFTSINPDNVNVGDSIIEPTDSITTPMVTQTEKAFVYEETYLNNIKFEVYAKEDIVTQDNQGTCWFKKGDLVATITTGVGAEFTNSCNGICKYNVDDETGAVTVSFPLGEYKIKEIETSYGNVLSEKTWSVKFTWENQDDVYVLDSSGTADENGVLKIKNERAIADVSILKKDTSIDIGISDTIFGFYTKDNIYAADGRIIANAGDLLTIVETDKDGKAKVNLDLPLMSEDYNADVTEEGSNYGLNSGNYYFVEQGISASYYLDKTPINIHLEYKDAQTPVIKAEAVHKNVQTETEIDKLTLAGSVELPNCDLKIDDKLGNTIINWTSGVANSIIISDKAEKLGYRNLSATMDDKGNLIVKGLFHDEEYILTETKPYDGYATAESITFMLKQGANEQGNVITTANIKDEKGSFVQKEENRVVMYDDTIKVEFFKYASNTGMLLPGTEWQVHDENGKVVFEFTTGKKATLIEGVLAAGRTYTFVETKTLKGYKKADAFSFVVSDTGEVQTIKVTNQYNQGKITTDTPDDFKEDVNVTGSPKSPKTGYIFNWLRGLMIVFASGSVAIYAFFKWRKKDEEII